MTVKTGTAWAGTFVTQDATGALATPSTGPAGVLYVDGTANAAEVTISGSNPYKFSVTLPALTAGQRVDMYITATIATIATAGVVASEQADTALTSEVKTETAAILADTNELQTDLVNGGRLDLLIDAIKAKTDVIPATPAAVGSAMTLTAAYDKAKDDVLTPLATVDGIVDAIKAKTDNLPADPADDSDIDSQLAAIKSVVDNVHDTDLPAVKTETAAILEDTGTTLPAAIASVDTDILAATVEGTYSVQEVLRIMVGVLAGKVSGGGTTTLTFRDLSDTLNIVAATVDSSGNRSGVTITLE